MREDFPERPGIGDERDQPDVAATRRARKRKLLTHPRHQYGPGNPGCVVGAGLFMSVGAAFRGGGTRSASRLRNPKDTSSTTPLAPCRVDFRFRPGPTQLAALMLERLKIARHVAVEERDADTRVDRKPAVLQGEHVGGGRGVEQTLTPRFAASRDQVATWWTGSRSRSQSVIPARYRPVLPPVGRPIPALTPYCGIGSERPTR